MAVTNSSQVTGNRRLLAADALSRAYNRLRPVRRSCPLSRPPHSLYRPARECADSFDQVVSSLPCWVEVDLDRIHSNVRVLQSWVGPTTSLAAVVKGGAYGLGAQEIAQKALGAGVQRLAVARVHEGVELRGEGITAPILVLSRTDPGEADLAVGYDLSITVETEELAGALGAAARRLGRRVPVHLKIDTGLHRFGVEPERALSLARVLATTPGLEVEGLWTHFASADEPDLAPTRDQLSCFLRVRQQLREAGWEFPIAHAANSAATLALPESHLDMVRVGLTLYGISPLLEDGSGPAMRSAVSFRSRIARVMTLRPGDSVGYGRTWRADQATRIGLITAGYADGVPRLLSNRGTALVGGQEVPLVGRVSMDHSTIDISTLVDVGVGTVVTLFGEDGNRRLDIRQLAEEASTIPHQVLTSIGARVARIYREEGEVVRVARLNAAVDLALEGVPRVG